MSYRLRRKTRAQADVEIYGGPLRQKRFDGGMNIDSPASEIKNNEVAYAENVIFREFGMEARPGTVRYSASEYAGITPTDITSYQYSPVTYTGSLAGYRHAVNVNGEIRLYKDNPGPTYLAMATALAPGAGGTWAAGTGDSTMIPFLRGWLTFTSSKITYSDGAAFQINAPNPIHGAIDDGSGDYKYRYLYTLSRIVTYSQDPTVDAVPANRLVSGAVLLHESGTNGTRYYNITSIERDMDYGEVLTSSEIDAGSGYGNLDATLFTAMGSISNPLDDSAAPHFTHVSIYRTLDIGANGIANGNNSEIYIWVDDVKRSDLLNPYTDEVSDAALRNRISSQNLILKTRGLVPLPSGSCAEVAGGWIFVADRSNATPETRLSYCAFGSNPENMGYYFADVQNYRFNDGIRALKANQDILSIFCNNSTHICNLTATNSDLSKLQYIPFLTYFHAVDKTLGIKDWGTLDSVDENSMIAVCSDGSVRLWDTTKWSADLAYDKVSREIKKIVPASTSTYARGSVGKFYNGAYYLWYSISSSDTKTTRCLRYGFGKQAGFGWGYYTGWIYPMFKCGAQVIVDSIGVQRLIVLDANNSSNFVWVETFRPFTGALDTYSYSGPNTAQLDRKDTDGGTYSAAGAEIAATWKFRELIGSEEADVLVHDETFHRWRPRLEEDGYRSGFLVSMSAYKTGSTTAAETITSQPKTGALKFTQEIASRRVQLAVSVNTGAWRYVGVDSHFRSLDKVNYATSGDVSSSESTDSYPQHQAALSSGLKHWATRRQLTLDRAAGTSFTATGTISTSTGPDQKAGSAYSFSSSYYARAAANTYPGDFTIAFGIKTPSTNNDFFSVLGSNLFYLMFSSSTELDVSGKGTVTVDSVASDWHLFHIQRASTSITVYQNNVLKGTLVNSPVTSFGGGLFSFGFPSGSGQIFDLRIYQKALTSAQRAYYIDDVINKLGSTTLPMV